MKKLLLIIILSVFMMGCISSHSTKQINKNVQVEKKEVKKEKIYSKAERIEYYNALIEKNKKFHQSFICVFVSKDEFEKNGLVWPLKVDAGVILMPLIIYQNGTFKFIGANMLCVVFDNEGKKYKSYQYYSFHQSQYPNIDTLSNGKMVRDFVNYIIQIGEKNLLEIMLK